MTDAARTPRRRLEQGTPALPVQVAGIDGLGPITPTNLPVAPTTSIPDRSQEFLARADQSVQRAFDIQQQNIESNLRASMAEAEARGRSRNTFGHSLAGALEAASAIFMNIKDKQQLANAAQFENETREFLFRFHSDIAEQGLTEGVISTHTAMQRELRKRYQGRVAPDVLQSISNIGWNALTGVQAQFGQRKINELEDARSYVVDQRLSQASILAAAEIARVSQTDPAIFGDQVRFNDTINGIVTRQLDALPSVSGIDRLKAEAFLRTQVLSSLQEQGFSVEQQQRYNDNLNYILQEIGRIQREFADNPVAFAQAMALLQVQSDQMDLGINVSDIGLGPLQVSEIGREYTGNIAAINDYQRSGSPASYADSPELNRARQIEGMAGALNYYNNPAAGNLFLAQHERNENPTEADTFVARQLNSLSSDIERVRQNDRRLNEIRAERAGLAVEIERAQDQLEPEKRLGNVQGALGTSEGHQTIIDFLTALRQQGRISPETADAILLRVQESERVLNLEERQLLEDNNSTLGYYRDGFGIDLRNPRDTSGILEKRAQVEPVLQSARNAPPPRRGPSDFQWGL